MDIQGFYIVKGDAVCDGKIDIRDVLAVNLSVLGTIKLTGDALTAADTNNDGKVDTLDTLRIWKHIAGVQMLTEVVEK